MGKIIVPGGGSGGFDIKLTIHKTVVSPYYHDQTGELSHNIIRKSIRPNGTIVELHVRVIVRLRCGHEAVLGNIDSCFLGTLVCKACIRQCGNKSCGLKLCVVPECRCSRVKDSVLYCPDHSGFNGFMSGLLGS